MSRHAARVAERAGHGAPGGRRALAGRPRRHLARGPTGHREGQGAPPAQAACGQSAAENLVAARLFTRPGVVVPHSGSYIQLPVAYAFGAVSPVSVGLLQVAGNRFLYGPIRRKQRQDFCTAFAFCLCNTDEALCLHTWLPLLDEQTRASANPPLGGFTPASWTREFREHLAAVGVPRPEEWYGHDIRRGAARDVFAASGVEAMLSRGGWRSLASARPYVSGDEVAAGLLAQGVIDDSGPEN